MLPFKITAVVACDDIRQEINNKAILVGVYNGALVVPGFPADIAIAWWIQMKADTIGDYAMEARVLKDGNSTLLRAMLQVTVHTLGWSTLALPRAPLQLQGPGHLELEIRLKDAGKWDTISELDIVEGKIAEAAPAVVLHS
jgi:hypothetical protein